LQHPLVHRELLAEAKVCDDAPRKRLPRGKASMTTTYRIALKYSGFDQQQVLDQITHDIFLI
jgi:hypothetical protein